MSAVELDHAFGNNIPLLLWFGGAGVTALVYILLFLSGRRTEPSFRNFILNSVSREAAQLVFSVTASAVSVHLLSNGFRDLLSAFAVLQSPANSPDEWSQIVQMVFCFSSPPAKRIMTLFSISEFFSGGALAMDVILHLMLCTGDPEQARHSGFKIRVIDSLCTLCQVWAWYLAKEFSGLRFVTIFVFGWGLRMLRYSMVFSKLDRRLLKKSEDRCCSSCLRFAFIRLGFVASKVILFLLAGALFIVSIEGIPCQHQVPAGVSPCACHDQLRESYVALYFIFTTATTVGYGDFFPVTNGGRAIVMLFMLIGIAALPGWLGHISDLLKLIDKLNHRPPARATVRQVTMDKMISNEFTPAAAFPVESDDGTSDSGSGGSGKTQPMIAELVAALRAKDEQIAQLHQIIEKMASSRAEEVAPGSRSGTEVEFAS
eukprot:c20063_g2_i3.p1 GENE.c20063_g2_i3~~c20063_g2_i3.p1  ORF type:complete len:502 (+),score=75.50 c20063_g2_i3:217-1506(+)